jgi:tetratricopeptide (TPR) repeat protein
MVLVEKGALKEAEDLLLKSENTLRQMGDRAGIAGVQHAWGKLYAAQGKAPSMERTYSEAISIYNSLKMPCYEAECHIELGTAYKKAGERDKALLHLRKAAVMYTDLKLDKWAKLAVKEIESI